MLVQRTPELTAAIEECEATGDLEQAGYLMAPALHACTGNTLEQSLMTCALLDALEDIPPEHRRRNAGMKRWVNEQLIKGE